MNIWSIAGKGAEMKPHLLTCYSPAVTLQLPIGTRWRCECEVLGCCWLWGDGWEDWCLTHFGHQSRCPQSSRPMRGRDRFESRWFLSIMHIHVYTPLLKLKITIAELFQYRHTRNCMKFCISTKVSQFSERVWHTYLWQCCWDSRWCPD